ncbi:hypothetical protein B0H19DRAFT_1262014 [Mycena capillaripes]|nr:hypothetical protein B0H19DRAFT_1262014 [Mycena capillaripes]
MDDESRAADEFASDSTFRLFESGFHTSGMFSGAQNLTVTGQTLTNITNYNTAPVVPSDFRMVPLGDIDLKHEIRFNDSTGIVYRRREWSGVRRLYSARVGGKNTTVAMYQGSGAEEITSNFGDYALIETISFNIVISGTGEDCPAGFLFLCPTDDFRTGPFSFCCPECPAYWSLDPLGVERLTTEQATELGFPSLQLKTRIVTRSWDASVYAGLRQLHKAKGFDPDSQDVARYLGDPLYQLSNEIDVPFAHVDDEDLCAEDDDQDFSMDLSW